MTDAIADRAREQESMWTALPKLAALLAAVVFCGIGVGYTIDMLDGPDSMIDVCEDRARMDVGTGKAATMEQAMITCLREFT